MTDLAKRIEDLRAKLDKVRGTPTEVYTRIVGYYRPVKNWNPGKRAEYDERKLFTQPSQPADRPVRDCVGGSCSIAHDWRLMVTRATQVWPKREAA